MKDQLLLREFQPVKITLKGSENISKMLPCRFTRGCSKSQFALEYNANLTSFLRVRSDLARRFFRFLIPADFDLGIPIDFDFDLP